MPVATQSLLDAEVEYHSYTLPRERETLPQVEAGDVVVWATPVYAGRIPNKTLDYVRRSLHADGNPAVALVTLLTGTPEVCKVPVPLI